MDGVDVSGFRSGREYVVDPRVARYLLLAGYATVHALGASAADAPRRSTKK
jgi:hypothetical protein